MMVGMRCAMKMTVRPVICTAASLWWSTLAVHSSRKTVWHWSRKTQAIHRSCTVPAEKIHTHLMHRLIQTVLQALLMPFEMCQAQGFKKFLVTVGPVEVEIAPHGSRKHQGILWNDGQPGANREYRDGLYVHSIHENDAPARLHHPEAREEERGLAASCAAADTQTCPRRDRQRQPLEHQRQVRLVPEFHSPKLERTRCQAT